MADFKKFLRERSVEKPVVAPDLSEVLMYVLERHSNEHLYLSLDYFNSLEEAKLYIDISWSKDSGLTWETRRVGVTQTMPESLWAKAVEEIIA